MVLVPMVLHPMVLGPMVLCLLAGPMALFPMVLHPMVLRPMVLGPMVLRLLACSHSVQVPASKQREAPAGVSGMELPSGEALIKRKLGILNFLEGAGLAARCLPRGAPSEAEAWLCLSQLRHASYVASSLPPWPAM